MQPLSIEPVTSLNKCRVVFWIERVQPINSQEIWPMRWQDPVSSNQSKTRKKDQSEEGWLLLRPRSNYISSERIVIGILDFLTDQYHATWTSPSSDQELRSVGERDASGWSPGRIGSKQNPGFWNERVYLPSSYPEGAYPCPHGNITQERSRSFPCFLLCFAVLEERRFGEDGIVNAGRLYVLYVFTQTYCARYPDRACDIWTVYNRVVEGLRCVQPISTQEIWPIRSHHFWSISQSDYRKKEPIRKQDAKKKHPIDSIDTKSSFYKKQRRESRDSHFLRYVT